MTQLLPLHSDTMQQAASSATISCSLSLIAGSCSLCPDAGDGLLSALTRGLMSIVYVSILIFTIADGDFSSFLVAGSRLLLRVLGHFVG